VANPCAKFEVSSLNRSRDIKGVPKIHGMTDSLTHWLTHSQTHKLIL